MACLKLFCCVNVIDLQYADGCAILAHIHIMYMRKLYPCFSFLLNSLGANHRLYLILG